MVADTESIDDVLEPARLFAHAFGGGCCFLHQGGVLLRHLAQLVRRAVHLAEGGGLRRCFRADLQSTESARSAIRYTDPQNPLVWSQSPWKSQKLRDVPDRVGGSFTLMPLYLR